MEIQLCHDRRAGVSEFAGPVGQPLSRQGGRAAVVALAAEELGAVGGERARRGRRGGYVGEGNPAGEFARPGVGGEQRTRLRVSRADDLQGA